MEKINNKRQQKKRKIMSYCKAILYQIRDLMYLKKTMLKNIKIGKKCRISKTAILEPLQGFIQIGDNCTINHFCVLYGSGGLVIGHCCRIATHTVIIGENHIYKDPNVPIYKQGKEIVGIKIGNDCWIGCNCSIIAGAELGDGCVVGAGSVVNKKFPPYSVIVGSPAKIISMRK